MKLLVQPGDGVVPLVRAITNAKSVVEIIIFRFDRREIEKALARAVSRGVAVRALIAHTNRAGQLNLRRLELRLLAAGVSVSRTADDLLRYHDKLMIIDRRELYLLAFNYTHQDMRSRSFGVVTKHPKLVSEAVRLFEADAARAPYTPELDTFVVSPANARKQLAAFIKEAKSELLIYDPKVSDPEMISVLADRAQAGVDIKIIGRTTLANARVKACKMTHLRLHTRTIIRDRQHAFVGSQSLRKAELDKRREAGVIFRDSKTVSRLANVFLDDWKVIGQSVQQYASPENNCAVAVAKEVAKAVVGDLPPVAPVVDAAVRKAVDVEPELDVKEIEDTVRRAVKQAVKEVVAKAVEDSAQGK